MFLNKLARFIQKLPGYLRILWNDEDWDYSHLLILLRHKLHRMSNYFETSGVAVDDVQTSTQIHNAVVALDILIADEEEEDDIAMELEYFCDCLNKNLFKWWN